MQFNAKYLQQNNLYEMQSAGWMVCDFARRLLKVIEINSANLDRKLRLSGFGCKIKLAFTFFIFFISI